MMQRNGRKVVKGKKGGRKEGRHDRRKERGGRKKERKKERDEMNAGRWWKEGRKERR